jgi:hypothetical protein
VSPGQGGNFIGMLFTGINYLAAIAFIGAVIFGAISLWHRLKNNEAAAQADEEAAEASPTADSEAKSDSAAAAPVAEEASESKEATADTPESSSGDDKSPEAEKSE